MRADLITINGARLLFAKQADLNNWTGNLIMLGGNHPIMNIVDLWVYPNSNHGYVQLQLTFKVKQVYNNIEVPGLDIPLYSEVEI